MEGKENEEKREMWKRGVEEKWIKEEGNGWKMEGKGKNGKGKIWRSMEREGEREEKRKVKERSERKRVMKEGKGKRKGKRGGMERRYMEMEDVRQRERGETTIDQERC